MSEKPRCTHRCACTSDHECPHDCDCWNPLNLPDAKEQR